MAKSLETRIVTMKEVAAHHSASSLWVAVAGKVYDITHFIFDHPGGEEILLQYGGQDVTAVMQSSAEHAHSDAAYDMLEPFCIGALDAKDAASAKNAHTTTGPDTSDAFIDINKPMLPQVWRCSWSKAHYLKMIHIPRHTSDSPRIFPSPFLELFSKTPWWFIPVFWSPIILYCIFDSLATINPTFIPPLFVAGIFAWTAIEYSLHRFLFHIDTFLPDHPYAFTIHFLFHGIHHFLPMDRMRLVMPPALGFTLAYPFWLLYLAVFPRDIGQALAAGSMSGFVIYDLIHYYIHHGRPFTKHLREMKTYHLDHHYKNPNLGFGITSKFWDLVFSTQL